MSVHGASTAQVRRAERAAPAVPVVGVLLPTLAVMVMLGSLLVGRYPVPLLEVATILAAKVLPLDVAVDTTADRVVTLVRLPRVLLTALVGGGLALCGAALQGLFRNPLVSAHILGVSSGAAFGGALAIVLAAGTVVFVGNAVVFGLLAIVLVYAVSRLGGRAPLLVLVLSGVIVGAFFTAGVSVLTYVADPYDAMPAIVFWLMGSMAGATWGKVALMGVLLALGGGAILLLRWRINVLSLGDEEAAALGLRVGPLRWAVLLATTVIVAGSVAVSGIVGWVGLVIPHVARMIVGPDHRRVLPASLWLGAAYLVLIDDLARGVTPAEIPIGIVTALIGAPVFLAIVWRMQRAGWSHD